MCGFCEHIETKNDYKEKPFWERDNCIVKYNEIYGLWVECDDSYYSGVAININYCPICGREL